ncbi:type II toxin-antitoxin system VapC family toxin [bacterium]|nr:type II toxin-antitoxin system VapC family toxin [bacterium]
MTKVLLLGNGFTRAFYDSKPWDNLVDKIRDKEKFPLPATKYNMPTPIKIEMLANGRNYLEDTNFQLELSELENKKNPRLLQKILDLNFDFVLTTNYTYEIECAILGGIERFDIEEMKRRHRSSDRIDPTEQKSDNLLYSFNSVENRCNNPNNLQETINVWHIHGEGIFPQNIVIGYDAYSRLLKSYIDYTSNNNATRNNGTNPNSWVDAFLSGDVYMLGFGMDFSEIDLWWLLQYKAKNHPEAKTVYFNPKPVNIQSCEHCNKDHVAGKGDWCKIEMLKIYGTEIKNIMFDAEYSNKYNDFYEQAYQLMRTDLERQQIRR